MKSKHQSSKFKKALYIGVSILALTIVAPYDARAFSDGTTGGDQSYSGNDSSSAFSGGCSYRGGGGGSGGGSNNSNDSSPRAAFYDDISDTFYPGTFGDPHIDEHNHREAERMREARNNNNDNTNSRVLCTYFTLERGWLPHKAYVGNLKYGQANFSQISLNGYHYWAVPLVRYLRAHQGSLREKMVFKVLVEGWVYETAYRAGYHPKGDWRGKIILATLKPLCTIIGHCVGQTNYQALWTDVNFLKI